MRMNKEFAQMLHERYADVPAETKNREMAAMLAQGIDD